jgi:hypothetical protein
LGTWTPIVQQVVEQIKGTHLSSIIDLMPKPKTVHKKSSKSGSPFPHFYRFIPAKVSIKAFLSQFFIYLIIFGVAIIVVVNLIASFNQPLFLKQLLQNPQDISALSTVLKNNQNPVLDSYLKQVLVSANRSQLITQIQSQKDAQAQQIIRLNLLLKSYPNYPDGYGLLAVWYFNQGYCNLAKTNISKAISLDPTRPVFKRLETQINSCIL